MVSHKLIEAPPAAVAPLAAERPLGVAARMLSRAPLGLMQATTVVGVLGLDDLDAFRAWVDDLCQELELDATITLQTGSYSVRFARLPHTGG